uniref:Uncharacterized protein n=1 Tax=Solanum lycopersicum TaxID=4081 RepID=A0A3Q7GHI5_SOLLC
MRTIQKSGSRGYGGTNFNPITETVAILKLKTQEEKLQKGNLLDDQVCMQHTQFVQHLIRTKVLPVAFVVVVQIEGNLPVRLELHKFPIPNFQMQIRSTSVNI